MNFNLNSLTYGPIIFESEVPAAFEKLIVPGSHPHYAEGPFGNILFQEIRAGQVTLFYNTYTIHEDLALDFTIDQPVLQIHVSLKNDGQYKINGIGDIHVKQGQFNMISSPFVTGTSFLEHDNEYRTFNLYFPAEYLTELSTIFPFLENFIKAFNQNGPTLLFSTHRWINASIIDIIDQLLYCGLEGESRQYYFIIKVQEFLFMLLSQARSEMLTHAGLNKQTINSIYQAKYLIETRFAEHITLQGICRQVGLTEAKLKSGFKQIFGIGVFELLLKTRMQIAKSLLLESDKPIKAIARLTGYATKQSFLTAFKNYYDDTPGSFRKNL